MRGGGRVTVITLLTDYGTTDVFAGVCRAVIARLAPGVPVVDLSHGVPRGDVLAGAVMLADCVAHLPAGVSLAVVDPGVGTARAAVALRAELRGEPHWFVGPDNGLLAAAVAACGGASSAWSLAVPAGVPATFHGRDVFAPAAARLATGADPAALGEPLDPAALHPLTLPRAALGPGGLRAEVLLIDGFGNLSLSAGPEDLRAAGLHAAERLGVRVDGRTPSSGATADPGSASADAAVHDAVLGRTFADVAPGRLLVHVDAAGRVAVAVNGGSAARRLGAVRGTPLALVRLGGAGSGTL